MKRIFFIIFACILLPSFAQAGIPISETKTVSSDQLIVKKDEPRTKKIKKNKLFRKVLRKIKGKDEGVKSKGSLFNWLSFGCGILAFLGIIAGSIFVAIGMSVAAIVLGIIGLKKKQRMKGFGIAGLILGGGFFALVLLLFVIFAAWLGGQ